MIISLFIFCMVSCKNEKNNDDKKDTTTVIEELNLYNDIDNYYENTFYYYSDETTANITFSLPLISNKNIDKADNVRFYNDDNEIIFNSTTNAIQLQETGKFGKYQGYLIVEIKTNYLLNYHFDKIAIELDNISYDFNVDISLENNYALAKENTSIFFMNYNYGLLEGKYVSYYLLNTNSKDLTIDSINNINDNFKINNISTCILNNTIVVMDQEEIEKLNFRTYDEKTIFNTDAFKNILIRVEYDDYSKSFLFEDIINIHATYDSLGCNILSSGVTLCNNDNKLEDFFCC